MDSHLRKESAGAPHRRPLDLNLQNNLQRLPCPERHESHSQMRVDSQNSARPTSALLPEIPETAWRLLSHNSGNPAESESETVGLQCEPVILCQIVRFPGHFVFDLSIDQEECTVHAEDWAAGMIELKLISAKVVQRTHTIGVRGQDVLPVVMGVVQNDSLGDGGLGVRLNFLQA